MYTLLHSSWINCTFETLRSEGIHHRARSPPPTPALPPLCRKRWKTQTHLINNVLLLPLNAVLQSHSGAGGTVLGVMPTSMCLPKHLGSGPTDWSLSDFHLRDPPCWARRWSHRESVTNLLLTVSHPPSGKEKCLWGCPRVFLGLYCGRLFSF